MNLKIWCSNCKSMQPLLMEPFSGKNKNGKSSSDLLCDTCRLVITTLESEKEGRLKFEANE